MASLADPTHYPVSEEMPEPTLQRLVMEELRPLVQRWLDARGVTAFVGADQFIYWIQDEPTTRIALGITFAGFAAMSLLCTRSVGRRRSGDRSA